MRQVDWFQAWLSRESSWLFLLVVFSALMYSPMLFSGLVWDAELLVQYDPRLRDLRHAFDYFHQGLWAFTGNRAVDYYRPLIGLLHNLEYHFFGLNPVGYNVVNLLLNAWACVLVYLFVKRWLPTRNSLVVAFVYAAISVRAEVVYWTYSDSHLLVTCFLLLAMIYYVDKKLTLAFLFFVLSLLTQESAVIFPFIFLVYTLLKNYFTRANVVFLIFSFVSLPVYLYLRKIALATDQSFGLQSLDNIFYLVGKIFKITFWQDAAITVYAQHPRSLDDFISYVGLGVGVVCLAVFLTTFFWKRDKGKIFWVFWFFFLIFPVVISGDKYTVYYLAEKIAFISCLGIIVLLADNKYIVRGPVLALVSIFIFVNSYQVYHEGKYWKSTETYLLKAIEHDNKFVLGLAALGDSYFSRGDHGSALKAYRRILEIKPYHVGAMKAVARINDMNKGIVPK